MFKHIARLALAASVALLGTLGVAQAQDNPPIAPITPDTSISGTISVWTWPNNDRTFAALMPTFNKAFPNIKVNVQGFPANNNVYLNTLQRAMLSGSGPDVAMIEIGMMALLRQRPQWEDLSKPPYDAGKLMASFAPFTVANVTMADGKIVALPKHTGPGGLFYRRDIFKEAGLPVDPDSVSKLMGNWDDFIAAGKKIAVANQRWMIGDGQQIVQAYMGQRGFNYFDKDGKLQFDTPAFHQAMEIVKKATDAGLISPFTPYSPEWQGAYTKGQIATALSGNWFGGLLKRAYATDQSGKWGVATAPAASGGTHAFDRGGDYIGILKTSNNKAAAWAFIKWLVTSDQALQLQFEHDDLYPAWLPAGKASWMNYKDPYYDGENVNSVFAPVQADLTPIALDPHDPVASNAETTAVDNVVKGVMSIDQAIAQAVAAVKAKM